MYYLMDLTTKMVLAKSTSIKTMEKVRYSFLQQGCSIGRDLAARYEIRRDL